MPYYETEYFDDPVEGEDVLEFRLLYSGQLKGASRVDTRVNLKHDIRRQFHPQLRRLWSVNSAIRHMTDVLGEAYLSANPSEWKQPEHSGPVTVEMRSQWKLEACLHYFAKEWERNGYSFIPLVTEV